MLFSASGAMAQAVFGGSDAIGSIFDRQNKMFTELVNKKLDGKLKINFIAGEQLGSDMQVIEQMMGDSVQLYGDDFSWYANWVKDFNIVSWGFLFRDIDHVKAYIDSPLFKKAAEELRTKHNVRILAAAPGQARVLFATKPIKGLADLQGLKMRVPEIKTYLALWETLGTKPARVAWGETFLGLKTGVVEGAEGGISSAYSAKFHEAAKNVIKTNHVIIIGHIACSDKWFQKQSPEVQKVLVEAAEEVMRWHTETVLKEQESLLADMEKSGATVRAIETGPIQEKAVVAVDKLEAEGFWTKGLWKQIQDLK